MFPDWVSALAKLALPHPAPPPAPKPVDTDPGGLFGVGGISELFAPPVGFNKRGQEARDEALPYSKPKKD